MSESNEKSGQEWGRQTPNSMLSITRNTHHIHEGSVLIKVVNQYV